MILYRIADKRFSNDLSGKGAALYGGRWNPKNVPVLYLASSVSLATLEVLVRFHDFNIINDYQLVIVHIPDNLVRETILPETLTQNWIQKIEETRALGFDWFSKRSSILLEIPSAVVPIDKNYLINPLHFEIDKVEIIDIVDFNFDNRLFKTHVF